jgi:hypothetical protein
MVQPFRALAKGWGTKYLTQVSKVPHASPTGESEDHPVGEKSVTGVGHPQIAAFLHYEVAAFPCLSG